MLKAQIYENLGIAVRHTGDPDKGIEFINVAKEIYIRGGIYFLATVL